jgi:peptide-methionine (S)-S-oxide reductase
MRLSGPLGVALVLLPVLAAVPLFTAHSETAVRIDPPAVDVPAREGVTGDGLATAVLAGGCFWGIQAVYQHTKGVTNAVSGYAGGRKEDADYHSVSAGTTDHAEAVAITYDPRVVSYGKLLHIFFSVAHDPTQLNRQGPDHGQQYRTEIFPQTDEQRSVAKAYVAQLDAAKAFGRPIVTRIEDGKTPFYPAEDYHQDFAEKHPSHPYIVYNDLPKVSHLKVMFPDNFRDAPVLVADAKAPGH